MNQDLNEVLTITPSGRTGRPGCDQYATGRPL